jgi:hypothetical protein
MSEFSMNAWTPIEPARHEDLLGCLPPEKMEGSLFLVGGAWDSDEEGNLVYLCCRYNEEGKCEAKLMTVAQFKKERRLEFPQIPLSEIESLIAEIAVIEGRKQSIEFKDPHPHWEGGFRTEFMGWRIDVSGIKGGIIPRIDCWKKVGRYIFSSYGNAEPLYIVSDANGWSIVNFHENELYAEDVNLFIQAVINMRE